MKRTSIIRTVLILIEILMAGIAVMFMWISIELPGLESLYLPIITLAVSAALLEWQHAFIVSRVDKWISKRK